MNNHMIPSLHLNSFIFVSIAMLLLIDTVKYYLLLFYPPPPQLPCWHGYFLLIQYSVLHYVFIWPINNCCFQHPSATHKQKNSQKCLLKCMRHGISQPFHTKSHCQMVDCGVDKPSDWAVWSNLAARSQNGSCYLPLPKQKISSNPLLKVDLPRLPLVVLAQTLTANIWLWSFTC